MANEIYKSNLSGVLLVDKAAGMTSHDVVAIARKALSVKKIGHCGTLDPMATGLLMLVIGQATKIQDLLMSENKRYEGEITLGVVTSTQDAEGTVLEEKPVPELSQEQVRAAFARFEGEFEQIPPMVSAIKIDGVPLYKLARQGKEVERPPRKVRVDSWEITALNLPRIHFAVNCSKGFYVRTYAHDIGAALGCGACLSSLRRTRSGSFTLDNAVPAASLKTLPRDEIIKNLLSLAQVSLMRGV